MCQPGHVHLRTVIKRLARFWLPLGWRTPWFTTIVPSERSRVVTKREGDYPPGDELESANSSQTPVLHTVGGGELGGVQFIREWVEVRGQTERREDRDRRKAELQRGSLAIGLCRKWAWAERRMCRRIVPRKLTRSASEGAPGIPLAGASG